MRSAASISSVADPAQKRIFMLLYARKYRPTLPSTMPQYCGFRRRKRKMRSLLMTPILSLVLGVPHAVWADSLWLGTDNTNSRSVLNTDLAGNLIRSVGPLEASGIAINAPA